MGCFSKIRSWTYVYTTDILSLLATLWSTSNTIYSIRHLNNKNMYRLYICDLILENRPYGHIKYCKKYLFEKINVLCFSNGAA